MSQGGIMSIKKYEAFLKTVELGSLTKAAELLGYTQSGISHMLNALEEESGLKLLYRDRSGVRLTSDGKTILPYMRSVCNENRVLLEKINEIKGVQAGVIRIGAFTSVSVQWLPKIIKSFRREYPNIEFELKYGDYAEIEKWIEQGRVDCGFTRMPVTADIKTYFLKKDDIVVILPEDHEYAQADKFPVSALCDYPYIQLDEGSDYEITAIFDKYKIKPNVRFTAKDDYAIIAMTASGLGISILPKLVLKNTNYPVVAKELDVPVSRDLCVAVKTEDMSAATKCFLKHTVKWAKKEYLK